MKKFIIVVMLLVCSSSLFAQRVDSYGIPLQSINLQVADALVPTVGISLGVGLGIALGAGMAAVISGGNAGIDAPKTKGVIPTLSAGYEFHFPDTRWSLGPELSYWHYGLASTSSYQHLHLATVVAAGKLYYKPSGICKLYGGLDLGAGISFNTVQTLSGGSTATKAEAAEGDQPSEDSGSDGPGIFPAIQFNPIGMRLGSEKVAFLAELGFGYKGIVQLGVNIAL